MQNDISFESENFSGNWVFFKGTLIFTIILSFFSLASGLGLASGVLPDNSFKIPGIILITGAVVLTFFLNRIKQNSFPLAPCLAYILGVIFAFPVMIINVLFQRQTATGALFQNYLIFYSLFVIYLNLKAKFFFQKNYNQGSGFEKKIGGNLAIWISWLAFAVFISSFFTTDLLVLNTSNEKAINLVYNLLSIIRIALPVVFVLTLIGLIKKLKSLILLANLINICSTGYVVSEIWKTTPGSSLLDFAGPSLIVNWIVVGVFFLCLIPDWKTEEKSLSEPHNNQEQPPKNFSFTWFEPGLTFVLIITASLTVNPLISKHDRLLQSIDNHDFAQVRKLISSIPKQQYQAVFNSLIRNPDLESFKTLMDQKDAQTFKVDDGGYLNRLFGESELKSLKFLIARGVDFSNVEFVRSVAFSHDPRDLREKFPLLEILLQERNKQNKQISEFYDPQTKPEYYFKKFLNPLAIAISKGNFEIAKFLWKKGFRIDDEVVAASAYFGKVEMNPLAPQLKLSNEHQIQPPISFILLESNLNDFELRFFLDLGIDLKRENDKGQNLFHAFALKRGLAGKEELLEQAKIDGVNIDKKDENGNTPLWVAATNNNIKTSSALIKLGADKTIKNKNGESLIDYCTKKKFDTLLAYLEE